MSREQQWTKRGLAALKLTVPQQHRCGVFTITLSECKNLLYNLVKAHATTDWKIIYMLSCMLLNCVQCPKSYGRNRLVFRPEASLGFMRGLWPCCTHRNNNKWRKEELASCIHFATITTRYALLRLRPCWCLPLWPQSSCFLGPSMVLMRSSIRHEIWLQHFLRNALADIAQFTLKMTAVVWSSARLICLPKPRVIPV